MNRSTVSLMDLPDEILFTIWNKLNKLDVLYSFVDVNRRFNKLIVSNLVDFNCTPTNAWRQHARLSMHDLPSTTYFLPNIINLRISVDTLDDCLYLLDGRLACLRTLRVKIYNIQAFTIDIGGTTLTNLQSFSLISISNIEVYDTHVLPILRRMISLEQLMLYLTVFKRSTFIDGAHFENEILIHMPRLQRFIFDVFAHTNVISEVNLRLNDDIQSTFLNGRYGRVVTYIEYYFEQNARSHVYSLPYTIDEALQTSNNFSRRLHPNVHRLLLSDVVLPFEHHFFF
ncbi:unnamed protein product [Rotaria magnacalcarata]